MGSALRPVASSSAIFSDVNVLPVPQAMISCPRSCVTRPSRTAARASRWCGRAVFLPVVGRTCWGLVQSMLPQSTLDSSRSLTPIRTTGTVRFSSCFSIVGPQSFAVETMIRLVNPFLLDAARKESTSALATWWVGS